MSKYQLCIGAIILAVLLPGLVYAAYDDVTLTTDTILTVGSYNLTVSGSNATIESITVNADDFQANVTRSSTFTIRSADRKVMTVTGITDSYIVQSCTNDYSQVVVTVPSSASAGTVTVTVTPTSASCVTTTPSGSISGGGSGGASIPAPVSIPVVIPAVSAVAASPVIFLKDLSRGNEGEDVMTLQKFLALDKEIYPEGIASGFFGPATERAVKRFQAKYGILQVGRVGPATREKIKMVSSSTSTPVPAPAINTAPVTAVFTKILSKGTSGDEVVNLQKTLNKDPDTQVAAEGTGSVGNESSVFGSLTEKAVQKFQVKYGIANPGDSGYGTVGPKTRAKLNELAK